MGMSGGHGTTVARLVRRPVPSDRLERTLEELAAALDRAHTLTDVGVAVVSYARARLPVDGVVLTLGRGRLAAAGPLVPALDALLGEAGPGPGAASLACGVALTIDDTRAETAWPDWSAAASRHGIRWVHLVGGLPLGGDGVRLDLMSHQPRACSGEDLARADELVNGISVALRMAHRVVHLEDAMHTRDLIGQGQGVVMERYGLDAEQAMSFLRRVSQQSQVKLHDLARDLVDGGDPLSAATDAGGGQP